MAVPISIRNMPDHIWSQLDSITGQPKQHGASQTYEMLQFPKTKVILWDATPLGTPIYLSVACYRKPKVHLSDKLLRLLHRQCENHPHQTLSTILLGSLVVDDDGEGITFQVDRLDTRQNVDNSLNLAPEDVTIPFQVYINGSKERQSSVEEFSQNLQALHRRCCSKEAIDLGGFVLTRGWCNFYAGGDNCVVHIDFNIVTIATEFRAIPISPVPIVPTALSKNLAGPLSFSHIQGSPKTGYLTMDHTRKLLLVLESDPKALCLPIVGIWISGAPIIHHPFVWSSCLRYIHNEHIQDRVCQPPDNFLVVLYSPLHSKPEFYECGNKSGNSEMDFDLHTGYEASNITKNSKNSGIISLNLSNVKIGPKREVFDAALNIFKRDRSSTFNSKATNKSSGPDDMEPRLTPAPLVAMAPIIQNLVPDVSFVLSEPVPVRQTIINGTRANNNQQNYNTPGDVPYSRSNSTSNIACSLPQHQRMVNQNSSLPSNRSNSNPHMLKGNIQCNSNGRQFSKNQLTSQDNVPSNMYQQSLMMNNFQQYPEPNVGRGFSCQIANLVPVSVCNRPNSMNGQYLQSNDQFQPRLPLPTNPQCIDSSNLPSQCPVPLPMPLLNSPASSAHRHPQQPINYHHAVSCNAQNHANFQQVSFQNVAGFQFVNAPIQTSNQMPVHHNHNNSAFCNIQTSAIGHSGNQNVMAPQNMRDTQNIRTQPQLSNSVNQQSRTLLPTLSENSQCSQNQLQADSTCSGKSSDDSGLSVTPDRLNPSPKNGSPEAKAQNGCKSLSLDSLGKDQCSPEVYNLLMQQDAQLKQLQSQIHLLLQHQQVTSPITSRNTNIEQAVEISDHCNSKANTCSVAINTSLFFPELDPTSDKDQSTSSQRLIVDGENQILLPVSHSDASDTSSAGQTPVEIRHKGVLPLNSTQREDCDNVDSTREDLLLVMNNMGIQDRTVGSYPSGSIIACPSFHSSSRSNCDSKNTCSTGSPPSASMCINNFQGLTSDDSQYSRTEGNSENPLYYENLIANIRQFLDSHEDNPGSDDSRGLTGDQIVQPGDNVSTNPLLLTPSDSQHLQTLLKSAQNGKYVDTTLIPKISYMSMMFDSDSDTSVEINAMAMKYLKDEQLTQMMKLQNKASIQNSKNVPKTTLLRQLLHTDHSDSPDLSQNGLSVNDMTFATRKYMEKHGLLTGSVDGSDKTIDCNYQLKTDYSISSTEMASPVRQTSKQTRKRNNPADAYTKLRLLKSPVKKEIVARGEALSPNFTPRAYNNRDIFRVQNFNHQQVGQCLQFSPENSPVFERINSQLDGNNDSFPDPRNLQYSSEDDSNILDIVKLKQLPKLL